MILLHSSKSLYWFSCGLAERTSVSVSDVILFGMLRSSFLGVSDTGCSGDTPVIYPHIPRILMDRIARLLDE